MDGDGIKRLVLSLSHPKLRNICMIDCFHLFENIGDLINLILKLKLIQGIFHIPNPLAI